MISDKEKLDLIQKNYNDLVLKYNILDNNYKNLCKEALEQPAQEPVAWMSPDKKSSLQFARKDTVYGSHTIPLYTHPHQWQGLTDEHLLGQLFGIRFQRHTENLMSNPPQIKYSYTIQESDLIKFARAIEQALKEKNT